MRVDRTFPSQNRARRTGFLILAFLGTWALSACSPNDAAPDAQAPAEAADAPTPPLFPAPDSTYPGAWDEDLLGERGPMQTISLAGEILYARVDTTGEIEAADLALAAAPEDVEALIQAGRVRRNWWHYREAMALYNQAIRLDSTDWRPWRYRGHRHISVREFREGVQALERARELAPLNWDVAYHLGLGYYLVGDYEAAATEYLRCLGLANDPQAVEADSETFRSCAANGSDPESAVAMTEWAARALLRAGMTDQANTLASAVPGDLDIQENVAYYHALLYQNGVKTADELLNPGPDAPYRLETVGYGVAARMLAAGDTAAARPVLERIAADPWWPGFGRIAAEVELARMR